VVPTKIFAAAADMLHVIMVPFARMTTSTYDEINHLNTKE
jgi:hypothetical protein